MKILLLFAVFTTIKGHINFFVRQAEDAHCPQDKNGQVSHPEHCDKFLNCWEGKASIGQCSHGLNFNPATSACDYPNNVDCNGKGDSRPNESDPRCPQAYGTFAGPRCNEFVVCHAGNGTVYTCPDMHSYDKTQGVCVRNEMCPPQQVADPPNGHIPPDQVIDVDNIRPIPPGGPENTEDNGILYPVLPSIPQRRCPIRTGFVPENDCHSVLVCVAGNGYVVDCGENYFHPSEGKCKPERSPLCPTGPSATFYVNVPIAPIVTHASIPQLYIFKK